MSVRKKVAGVDLRIVVLAAGIVALVVSAALLLAPRDEGTAQGEEPFGTLEYSVEGTYLFIPFSGTARVELFNVTEDGYWARISVEGIPLAQSKTKYFTWEEAPAYVSDIGPKVGNATLSTPWGEKRTEVYVVVKDGTEYTSYLGTDPRVVYRMVGTGGGIEVTMTLTATDIDAIKSGNGS